MQTLVIEPSTSWVLLDSGITVAVVQSSGFGVEVGYTGSGQGFRIPSGIPVSIPHIEDFGGSVYVRSIAGGSVRYETA